MNRQYERKKTGNEVKEIDFSKISKEALDKNQEKLDALIDNLKKLIADVGLSPNKGKPSEDEILEQSNQLINNVKLEWNQSPFKIYVGLFILASKRIPNSFGRWCSSVGFPLLRCITKKELTSIIQRTDCFIFRCLLDNNNTEGVKNLISFLKSVNAYNLLAPMLLTDEVFINYLARHSIIEEYNQKTASMNINISDESLKKCLSDLSLIDETESLLYWKHSDDKTFEALKAFFTEILAKLFSMKSIGLHSDKDMLMISNKQKLPKIREAFLKLILDIDFQHNKLHKKVSFLSQSKNFNIQSAFPDIFTKVAASGQVDALNILWRYTNYPSNSYMFIKVGWWLLVKEKELTIEKHLDVVQLSMFEKKNYAAYRDALARKDYPVLS